MSLPVLRFGRNSYWPHLLAAGQITTWRPVLPDGLDPADPGAVLAVGPSGRAVADVLAVRLRPVADCLLPAELDAAAVAPGAPYERRVVAAIRSWDAFSPAKFSRGPQAWSITLRLRPEWRSAPEET